MLPLSGQDNSDYIQEEIRDLHGFAEATPSIDLDANEFIYLFDDGGDGTYICAAFPPRQHPTCEIFQFYQPDAMLGRMFRGVEPMIQTAIEAWRSGIFSSSEDNFGWKLDYEFKDWLELGKRLNPGCNYWLDGYEQ